VETLPCEAYELDGNNDLKIKEIKYWTEWGASDRMTPVQKLWMERRAKALAYFAEGFLDGRPIGCAESADG